MRTPKAKTTGKVKAGAGAGAMAITPLRQHTIRLLTPKMQEEYFGGSRAFGRYGTSGDGTCFFHSMCAARNTDDYLHASASEQCEIGKRFRCAFTNHLTDDRWRRFLKQRKLEDDRTADVARKQFCEGSHWADETMIRYVSDALKMNIIFLDMSTKKIYCGVRGHKKEPLVIVSWIDRMHFEPVVRIVDPRRTRDGKVGVQMVFNPSSNSSDKEVVDTMMRSYYGQCGTE
jgi:hypothetical protein